MAGNNAFKAAASEAASMLTCNAASLVRMVARDASAASLSAGMVALMSKGAKAAFLAARLASCAMTLALVISTVIMFYAPAAKDGTCATAYAATTASVWNMSQIDCTSALSAL